MVLTNAVLEVHYVQDKYHLRGTENAENNCKV